MYTDEHYETFHRSLQEELMNADVPQIGGTAKKGFMSRLDSDGVATMLPGDRDEVTTAFHKGIIERIPCEDEKTRLWRRRIPTVDPHVAGAKLDTGKNRLGLVLLTGFPRALQAVGEVGTLGANKYTDNGWLSVKEGESRYMDAMMRHLLSHCQGDLLDAELGTPHLAQACWNLLAVLELSLRGR